jgi:hypothetical protein
MRAVVNQRRRVVLISVLALFVCGGLCLSSKLYLNNVIYQPTGEEVFSHYLTYPGNADFLQNATNVQSQELAMGQGVYLRFEADKGLVIDFLERDRGNEYSYHYPYVTITCEEFYEAYPDWADSKRGYKWWKPREITSPECYVTRGCEYFLFDRDSETIYYYFFPDFLSKDFLCINFQGKRQDIRR